MKSTPASARATPLHGQVKLVPSIRNWFSLVPEPKDDTVVVVPPELGPLEGDVGEIPGAMRMKSNMLARVLGVAARSSGPNRVPNPGFRASMRDPFPCTTIDSSRPATLRL